MRVLVTGSNGQLGHDVCRELSARNIQYLATDKKSLDITDRVKTIKYIKDYNPDAVIHCAAYTAVDKAEDEIDLCCNVNTYGTKYISEACKTIDAKMAYISTDYVFPGTGNNPYEINDETKPLNTYGKTKLEGEDIVKSILDKYFIVRISWVFGINGNNFVKTMLQLGKDRDSLNIVSDQIGSPTYTYDLAPLLCDMIESDKYGVYHATNEGYCSWAEFAEAIFAEVGFKTKVNKICTAEYHTKAVRPLNSQLSKQSLDENGFNHLPSWQDALRKYLKEIG